MDSVITFKRYTFDFVVQIITNEKRLVLFIKTYTKGSFKPRWSSLSIHISFVRWSSQSGNLTFDIKSKISAFRDQKYTATKRIYIQIVGGHVDTLKCYLSDRTAITNVESVSSLVNRCAVWNFKTCSSSKSILASYLATPSMKTHQSWQ